MFSVGCVLNEACKRYSDTIGKFTNYAIWILGTAISIVSEYESILLFIEIVEDVETLVPHLRN